VPDVLRAQIRNLKKLFKEYLICVLSETDIMEPEIQKILSEYSKVEYAKTNSKSVLGSMNDLAFHYKYHILEAGGVHSYAVPSIIKNLNHMPMGAIDYAYPIDLIRAMYKTAK